MITRSLRGPIVTPIIAAILVLAGCAGTPAALRSAAERSSASTESYLDRSILDRLAQAVPPPPRPGSLTDLADKDRSARMTALEDSDRWLLSTAHAELRAPLALQHFNCALGVRLDPQATPELTRLMQGLFHDADTAAEVVKARAFRARPVGDTPERQSCQRLTEAGRRSASYPSGSSTVATAYGEAFAALDPERAVDIRRMAHEIGQSRLVCGMHYPSDIAVGEDLGRAVFAAAVTQPRFAIDLTAARTELIALRSNGQTAPDCVSQAQALATRLP